MPRRSPVKHKVRGYTKRNGNRVLSYVRGTGARRSIRVGGRELKGIAKGEEVETGEKVFAAMSVLKEVTWEEPTAAKLKRYKKLPVLKRMYGLPIEDVPDIEIFDYVAELQWKRPTRPMRVKGESVADRVSDVLSSFCGGAEVAYLGDGTYVVKSKGYYHYIGA